MAEDFYKINLPKNQVYNSQTMFNKLVDLLSRKFCIENGVIKNEEIDNLSIIETAFLWRYYHTIENENFNSEKFSRFKDLNIFFQEGLGLPIYKNNGAIIENSGTLFGNYDIEFDVVTLPPNELMEFNLSKLDGNGNAFFKYLNTIIHEFEHRHIVFKYDLDQSFVLSKKGLNAPCQMKKFAPYVNAEAYDKMIKAIDDIDNLPEDFDIEDFINVVDYTAEINYNTSKNELNSIKVANNEGISLFNAFLVKLKNDLSEQNYTSEKLESIGEILSVYLDADEEFITQIIPMYTTKKDAKNAEFAVFGKTIQKLWIEKINSNISYDEKIEYAKKYVSTLNISSCKECNDLYLNSDAPLKYKNYAINHDLTKVSAKQLYYLVSQNFDCSSGRGIAMLNNLVDEFNNINQNLLLYYFVDIAGSNYIKNNLNKIPESYLYNGLHKNLRGVFELYNNPQNPDTIHLKMDIENAAKMNIDKLKSQMQTYKVGCSESD